MTAVYLLDNSATGQPILTRLSFVSKNAPMPIIKIDNKDYEFDTLPDQAKAQLNSLQFVESELQRLGAKAAVLQTARASYAKGLSDVLLNTPSITGGDTIKLG
jgi:hypothetical protein